MKVVSQFWNISLLHPFSEPYPLTLQLFHRMSYNPSIADLSRIAKKGPKSTALFGVALAAGVAGVISINHASQEAKVQHRLEEEFGTADGYFPSATPGASLSKPPGNKNVLVGEHYVPVSERRTYASKRMSKQSA